MLWIDGSHSSSHITHVGINPYEKVSIGLFIKFLQEGVVYQFQYAQSTLK